jgi:hypothetical protein
LKSAERIDGAINFVISAPAISQFPIQKCAISRKFKKIGGIARRRTFVRRTSDSAD